MGEDHLRIAQFTTHYPYPDQLESGEDSNVNNYLCSGAERVVKELSEAFATCGHSVDVFTASAARKFEHETHNGVSVHRSPRIAEVGTTSIPPTLLLDHIGYDFDVIHAHNSTPPGMVAGYFHSLLMDTPLVITHHGGEQYQNHGSLLRRSGLYLYNRILLKRLFRYADRVVSPSQGYIAESEFLSSTDRTVTSIPNGVNLDTFDIPLPKREAKQMIGIESDEFCVLYLGTHYRRKGVHILLDAFTQFHDEVPDSRLVLAGKGELTPSLQQAVADRQLHETVLFPGYVPEADKATYLRAADVLVLPSIPPSTEMFPLVILEAAAAGTPVIASDFPTIRGIVDNYDVARLVQPGNGRAIVEVLRQLYTDEALLANMRDNAWQMAAEHSWRAIADRYVDLYRNCG